VIKDKDIEEQVLSNMLEELQNQDPKVVPNSHMKLLHQFFLIVKNSSEDSHSSYRGLDKTISSLA